MAETFTPWSDGNVFLSDRVDPDVVRVEGDERLWIYHTMLQEGHPGLAETWDGLNLEDLGDLPNLDDNSYDPKSDPLPGDVCFFDPSYLRLPDGTMLMYLSVWATEHDGYTYPHLWRAIATDGPAR